MALENELRKILRDDSRFPSGAITFTEYAMGGDSGAPDAWFSCDSRWNPLELKRGKNPVKSLRPSQVRWHKDSLRRGVASFLATIHQGKIEVYFLVIIGSALEAKLIMAFDSSSFSEIDLNSCYYYAQTW